MARTEDVVSSSSWDVFVASARCLCLNEGVTGFYTRYHYLFERCSFKTVWQVQAKLASNEPIPVLFKHRGELLLIQRNLNILLFCKRDMFPTTA